MAEGLLEASRMHPRCGGTGLWIASNDEPKEIGSPTREKKHEKLLHCYIIGNNQLCFFPLSDVAAPFCYTLLHLATPCYIIPAENKPFHRKKEPRFSVFEL